MTPGTPKRSPRKFRWSQTARDIARANLNVNGSELHRLIARIAHETGNPRDACLRFVRQFGVMAKRRYQKWSPKELKILQKDWETPVRQLALDLRRSPSQIYGMMHRLGISTKNRKESLSLYSLARALRKRPSTVRRWIEKGALQAENEGSEKVPRLMISVKSLQHFYASHPRLIAASGVDKKQFEFLFQYVFPSSPDLAVRESKKEREAFEQQRRSDALDIEDFGTCDSRTASEE